MGNKQPAFTTPALFSLEIKLKSINTPPPFFGQLHIYAQLQEYMRLKKLFLGDINCSEGEAAPWASDSTKPAENNCSLIPWASGLAAGTYPGSASGRGQRQPGQRRHCAGSPNAAPVPLLQQRCEERAEEI